MLQELGLKPGTFQILPVVRNSTPGRPASHPYGEMPKKLRVNKGDTRMTLEPLFNAGPLPVEKLAELREMRTRDFKRRNLARMLEEGVVTLESGIVSLAAGWFEAMSRQQDEAEKEVRP